MGSSAVAAWIAHVAFWVLLAYGLAFEEIDRKRLVVFLVLWLAGLFGLQYVPYAPAHAMFPSFVALLDVALVFIIFKGDLPLT
jgi:hypothetical protein